MVYFIIISDKINTCYLGDAFRTVDQPVLEPLLLPDRQDSCDGSNNSPRRSVPCILCDNVLDITNTLNDYLKHLLEEHRFVIADVKLIANFRRYSDIITIFFQNSMKQPICDFFPNLLLSD